MKATAPTAEQPPHVSNHTFPNDGVTLEFLQSIADSSKMKQPMYELAGMTKSEVDATDLDSLRKICQKYHVLGTAVFSSQVWTLLSPIMKNPNL